MQLLPSLSEGRSCKAMSEVRSLPFRSFGKESNEMLRSFGKGRDEMLYARSPAGAWAGGAGHLPSANNNTKVIAPSFACCHLLNTFTNI